MSNLSSIYHTVISWYASTTYNLWDVVTNDGKIYYALQNHVSTSNFTTDLNNGKWGGHGTFNNQNLPSFLWKPSYNSQVQQEPKVRLIKFGESYEQRASEGINNNLIKVNLNFDLRTDNECIAICHFLHLRAGIESFIFTMPKPFGIVKRFVCRTWNENFQFYDNHDIKATFEEVPV
jgi:phage-related protein